MACSHAAGPAPPGPAKAAVPAAGSSRKQLYLKVPPSARVPAAVAAGRGTAAARALGTAPRLAAASLASSELLMRCGRLRFAALRCGRCSPGDGGGLWERAVMPPVQWKIVKLVEMAWLQWRALELPCRLCSVQLSNLLKQATCARDGLAAMKPAAAASTPWSATL